MQKKSYKTSKKKTETVNEPEVVYGKNAIKTSSSGDWNPNVPFHGTQEEWWEHFHRIEEGEFYPASETHKRISKWLDNQKK